MPRDKVRRATLRLVVGALLAAAPVVTPGSPSSGASDPGASPAFHTDPKWGLDPGFGQDGLAFGPSGVEVTAVAAAGDATWFAGSIVSSDGHRVAVVGRRTASGALDTSVGGGRGWTTFESPGSHDTAAVSLAIDERGRPVVVARTDRVLDDPSQLDVDQVLVARFTRRLRPDQSFGNHGLSLVRTSGDEVPTDVALQRDGGIVMAGHDREAMFALRLRPDGSPDPKFGSVGDGFAALRSLPMPSYANALTLTDDGRIVLVGAAGQDQHGEAVGALARLLPSGALDPAFGSDGFETVPGPSLIAVVRASDGDLVTAGSGGNGDDSGGFATARLVRSTSAGQPASWPGSTTAERDLVLTPLRRAGVSDLVQQRSGNLAVVGTGSRDSSTYDGGFLTVRTGPDGRPLRGFGRHGQVLVPWRTDTAPHTDSGTAAFAGTVDAHDRIVEGGIVGTVSPSGGGMLRFAEPTASATR